MTKSQTLHRLLPLLFIVYWSIFTPFHTHTTQQWASTIIGAVAGGGTGASTGLDGEKYNRQLHQREIAWIKAHALAFAKKLYGDHPTPEQIADARARLAQQALRGVDKGWSLKLGSKTDQKAKAFLDQNNANLFTVKNQREYLDGSTNGEKEISDLSNKEFNELSSFYGNNLNKATTTNPEGRFRNANEIWANEKGLIDAIKEGKISAEDLKNALKNLPSGVIDSIKDIPDTAKSAGNYVDAVLPTKNQERLDTLYGSHTDGSVLQANLHTGDAVSVTGMVTGAGGIVKAGAKGAIKAIDGTVDEALDIRLNPLDGTETTLEEVRSSVSTAKSYQSKEPRTLHEQLTIEEVKANPEIGDKMKGNRNKDPLFHSSDNFEKRDYTHELSDGQKINIHYQYNHDSGKAYDIKIETPKPKPILPWTTIKDNK